MGLLQMIFKEKRDIIKFIGDMIILIGFIGLAFYAKGEAERGYRQCVENACAICSAQQIINQSELLQQVWEQTPTIPEAYRGNLTQTWNIS